MFTDLIWIQKSWKSTAGDKKKKKKVKKTEAPTKSIYWKLFSAWPCTLSFLGQKKRTIMKIDLSVKYIDIKGKYKEEEEPK